MLVAYLWFLLFSLILYHAVPFFAANKDVYIT